MRKMRRHLWQSAVGFSVACMASEPVLVATAVTDAAGKSLLTRKGS